MPVLVNDRSMAEIVEIVAGGQNRKGVQKQLDSENEYGHNGSTI